MFKNKEEQFDFYWKEIFTGLAYNPIEFNTYRFDQTMSLPGKVNKLYDMFKVLALNNQEVMDYLKAFVETFDEKLYKTIYDVLIVWLEDGMLSEIVRVAINEEVIKARTDYLDVEYETLKQRLDNERKEVIESRGAFNDLSLRLNSIDKHIEYLGRLITDYGADPTGELDSSRAIQEAVNNNKFVIIPEGVFKVSSIRVPEDVFIIGQGKQSVIEHFGNKPLFVMREGFKGSHIRDFSITGGLYGIFSIEIGRPHCTIENIYTFDYKGSGIDLITLDNSYGTSAWGQRISNYTYIGYSERDSFNKIYSPSPEKTWGIRMNLHGGNVIIKDFNIQIANVGIESNSCEQLTIADFNISETTSTIMKNNVHSCVGIELNKGHANTITGGYMEAYDQAITLKKNKNTEVSNTFFSGGIVNTISDLVVSVDNLNTKLSNLSFRNKTKTNVKINSNNVGVLLELIDGVYVSDVQYLYTDGRRLYGNYDSGNLFNLYTWLKVNGNENSGVVYVGRESNRLYTTDGLIADGKADFVLPGDAINGAVYTFIKTKPSTLVIRPNSGGAIYPKPNTATGYKELGGVGLGSITLVKGSNGWNVTSSIGEWK